VHYSSVLVTSLMKTAGNVACATDIIQTIENSQKCCNPTAWERETTWGKPKRRPAWDSRQRQLKIWSFGFVLGRCSVSKSVEVITIKVGFLLDISQASEYLEPTFRNTLSSIFTGRSTNTYLWRWKRQSVPKRRLLIFRSQGNTQKKIYLTYNTSKIWKLW
jgi:hypothetical protein